MHPSAVIYRWLHLGLQQVQVQTSRSGGYVHRMLCKGHRHLLLGCSNPFLLHTYLRRRFPIATLHRTTRRSWCCRSCQRWIQEPSISGEAESGRGQGALNLRTKQYPRPGPRAPLPLNTYAEPEHLCFPAP